MKKLFTTAFVLCLSVIVFAQSKEAGTEREALKQFMTKDNTLPVSPKAKDEETVRSVLKLYNSAVEKLDVTGTEKLFTADSKIYESGGSEGSYAHYMEHHLAPELKEFKSFNFSDYKVDVTVSDEYAFSTETYIYTLVLAKDGKEIKSKGVATSVLKKTTEGWKILSTHSSFRKAK